jgi:hypothetical protein
MDVVQPLDPGSPGGLPPPPSGEPGAPIRPSATTIHGFLAVVRRRLLLEAALRTAGYGTGVLGAVVLLLALIATNVGPAAFWPAVTVGRERDVHHRRDDRGRLAARVGDTAGSRGRAPCRHADAFDGERPAVRRRARRSAAEGSARGGGCRPRWCRAFQGLRRRQRVVGRRTPGWCRCGPRGARSPPPSAAIAAVIVIGTLSSSMARGLRTLVHRPSLFEGAAISDGACWWATCA